LHGSISAQSAIEFRNGSIITVTVQESLEFDVESVVLVRLEENHIEVVPDELWPEESWVGVVHLIKGEKTILSVGDQQRIVPTSNGKEYQVGNTVEVKDKYGVVEVLSERPLSSLDAIFRAAWSRSSSRLWTVSSRLPTSWSSPPRIGRT
jgi:transitional endoplasmic reticulum ATPase